MGGKSLLEHAVGSPRMGKDGILFNRRDDAFEQLGGEMLLTDDQRASWVEATVNRAAWCAERGITYVMFVIPEKQVIYADKLPDDAWVSPLRPVTQIIDGLAAAGGPQLLYPVEPLRQARLSRETYFLTDSHWSSWGAYIGYRALIKALAPRHALIPIETDALDTTPDRFIGDLGAYLDPEPFEDGIKTIYPGHLRTQLFFTNSAQIRGLRGQVHIFTNGDATMPRAVMFRDSGANALFPFLNTHFARMVAVAINGFDTDVIESERPDIVITEIAERLVGVQPPERVAEDAKHGISKSFSSVCGSSLPLPIDESVFRLNLRLPSNGLTGMLTEGWIGLGHDQIWAVGARSTLRIPNLPLQDLTVKLDLMPFHDRGLPVPQTVRLSAAGAASASYRLTSGTIVAYEVPGAAIDEDGSVTLTIDHPDAIRPSWVAPDSTEPDLAMILLSIWVLPRKSAVS